MIYYLRNKKNQTIFELEFWVKDEYESDGSKRTYHEFSTNVDIETYSKYLLETPKNLREIIIRLFSDLSEYRGWLWEKYYMTKKNEGLEEDRDKIHKHLDETFTNLTNTFSGLTYVID